VQLADVDVRGRPVALNIHGRVRDLELPPLSPYAIKYAGYGIDRGKLSVDVNYAVLPVSGSINDPQFKLGPVVFKLITNLIVKAITAPFSLLASALGGGGDELGTVPFVAGQDAAATPAVTDTEYPVLLKAVYRRADITKPRNLVGLKKRHQRGRNGVAVDDQHGRDGGRPAGAGVATRGSGQGLPCDQSTASRAPLFWGLKVVPPQNGWKPQAKLSLTAN
jgi:hypothetical protein